MNRARWRAAALACGVGLLASCDAGTSPLPTAGPASKALEVAASPVASAHRGDVRRRLSAIDHVPVHLHWRHGASGGYSVASPDGHRYRLPERIDRLEIQDLGASLSLLGTGHTANSLATKTGVSNGAQQSRGWVSARVGRGVTAHYGVADSGILMALSINERTSSGELAVAWKVDGLTPILSDRRPGGHARIALRDAAGNARLWLRGAFAEDATGRALRAWFEATPDTVEVHVDDAGATYPVFVDPTVGGTIHAVTSNQVVTDDGYGQRISLAGSTLAVAARWTPGAQTGAVYIFTEQADGTWLETNKLLPPGNANGPLNFGSSVSLSPSVLVVGFGGDDFPLAYAYQRPTPSTFLKTAEHAGSVSANQPGRASSRSGARFALASNGLVDVVTVQPNGTLTLDGSVQNGGASGTGALLFGDSVAIDGDRLLVGAPAEPGPAGAAVGAAYMYERQGDGTWLESQALVGSVAKADSLSGRAVALRGDRLAIGSYRADIAGGDAAGEAFVFAYQNGTWVETDVLQLPNAHPHTRFGRAMALNDDYLVVGAPGHLSSGAVMPYRFTPTGLEPGTPIIIPGAAGGQNVGRSLCLEGNRLAIGANRHVYKSSIVLPSNGEVYITRLQSDLGDACTLAEDCASGLCVDAVCCDVGCDGECQRCDLPGSLGTCGMSSAGTDPDGECGGETCGTNGCLRALANACTVASQCVSGLCVDGVCCDTPCIGGCDRCDLVGREGTCSLAAAGTVTQKCFPFVCDGVSSVCPDRCDGAEGCAEDSFCRGGLCTPKRANGDVGCSAGNECVTGHCVDGQCCNAACEGDCLQCLAGQCRQNACGGFKCRSEPPDRGACLTECISTADCQNGYQCDAGGSCIVTAPPAEGSDNSGCGCRVVAPTSDEPPLRGRLVWLLAALCLFVRRRQRHLVKAQNHVRKPLATRARAVRRRNSSPSRNRPVSIATARRRG